MSAVKEAIVAELLKWVDPGKGAEEAAYSQVESFLRTSLGKKISAALKFESALRKIVDPIGHIQKEAERDGNKINGAMLVSLIKEASFYQDIAKDALKGIPKIEMV